MDANQPIINPIYLVPQSSLTLAKLIGTAAISLACGAVSAVAWMNSHEPPQLATDVQQLKQQLEVQTARTNVLYRFANGLTAVSPQAKRIALAINAESRGEVMQQEPETPKDPEPTPAPPPPDPAPAPAPPPQEPPPATN